MRKEARPASALATTDTLSSQATPSTGANATPFWKPLGARRGAGVFKASSDTSNSTDSSDTLSENDTVIVADDTSTSSVSV